MEHLVKVASLPPALIVAITIISVLPLNLFAVKLTAFATDCHRKMLVWMLIFGTQRLLFLLFGSAIYVLEARRQF